MEFHQLRYFVTAVRLGTMSAAARELYVSQPSVSQQIRALERELGASLMLRQVGRRLSLTEAGEEFLAEAERALAAADAGRARVRQVLARAGDPVKLGAVPSVDSTLLPKALDRFMSQFPSFRVVVLGPNVREVEAMVLSGELDVALTHFPPTAPGLSSRVLMFEELVLVGPPEHWAVRRRRIDLAQVRNEWFVSCTRGSELQERLLRLCAEAGFTPRIALEARYGALREMVLAGHGLGILPRLVVDEGLPSVPIASKLATRELYVVSKPRARLGAATTALLSVLESLA
jgi:DNA-binding transcriptional LysR family regulator